MIVVLTNWLWGT